MKKIIRSYLAFTSKGYRIAAVICLPLAFLILRVILTLLADDPDLYIFLFSEDCMSIILLELMADRWIFGGICGKDSPRIEYLRTSGRGEQAIRNALIGDLLRRFVWMMIYACIIFALTGQIRTFSSTLSIYIVITAMLNFIRYIKTATYQQLLAFFTALIYFLCEMSFTIANYIDEGYAPAARWALPLLAVIAIVVSILTLRHMMFHIEENRYCMKRSLPEHLLHRERKETL